MRSNCVDFRKCGVLEIDKGGSKMKLKKRTSKLNSVEAYLLRYPVCANCTCGGPACQCPCVGVSSKEQASSYLHTKNSNGVYDDAAHYTAENGRSL